MEIKFADSFWESLKVLNRQQTWWYKTYEFFRRDLPYFLENVWYFRKQLWSFRSWDYSHNLQIFGRSLEKTVNTIENGHEIDKTRLKKVEKMKRSIYLINRIKTENYIEQAELELGKLKNVDWLFGGREDTPEEREHNKRVFDRANELERSEWNELWTILRGQDLQEYKKICESKTLKERIKNDVWGDWFDGSGMNTWWD
jgi:hypothetical protein